MTTVFFKFITLWLFLLIFIHLNRSIRIVSAYWIVSASITINWVLSLSRWNSSLNDIFFVRYIVRNIRISLLLCSFFLFIHKIFNSFLNLSASVTYIFHTYFDFLFTHWILSFSWTTNLFINLSLRLSTVYSWSNIVDRVVSNHSTYRTFRNIWYVISYVRIRVIPW